MNIYIYDDDMMMRKSDGSVIVQGKVQAFALKLYPFVAIVIENQLA